eukprot:1154081-Pelagomonas_calceolata.AAC.21
MFIAASSVARYLKTYGMATLLMCRLLLSHTGHTTRPAMPPPSEDIAVMAAAAVGPRPAAKASAAA